MNDEIDIIFIDEDSQVIKNKCETCLSKALFNFDNKEYGIRCKIHKLDAMVNIFTKKILKRDLSRK